jgi:hypothetical protein
MFESPKLSIKFHEQKKEAALRKSKACLHTVLVQHLIKRKSISLFFAITRKTTS